MIVCRLTRESGEGVRYDLDCGVSWEEAFDGPPPEDVAALAFMGRDEAQAAITKRSI